MAYYFYMKKKLSLILLVFAMAEEVLATPGHVLFGECRNGSIEEMRWITATFYNRVQNRNFGNLKTVTAVVNQKNAYCSARDAVRNKNWNAWWTISAEERALWEQRAKEPIANDDVVLFHDKTITEPVKWVNRAYFDTVLVKETKHFRFYKLVLSKSYKPSARGWKAKVDKGSASKQPNAKM